MKTKIPHVQCEKQKMCYGDPFHVGGFEDSLKVWTYSYVINIIVRNNANPMLQTYISLTIKIKLFSKQDAFTYKQNVRSHKPGGAVWAEIKISICQWNTIGTHPSRNSLFLHPLNLCFESDRFLRKLRAVITQNWSSNWKPHIIDPDFHRWSLRIESKTTRWEILFHEI